MTLVVEWDLNKFNQSLVDSDKADILQNAISCSVSLQSKHVTLGWFSKK